MNPEMLLFLAERMGVLHEHTRQIGDECIVSFTPHTDRAQFADVVIWAWQNGIELNNSGDAMLAFIWQDDGWLMRNAVSHNSTPSGIMAATVEAVARAAGWEDKQ